MMMRGTKVRINDKANPPHLRGGEGIALERAKNSGYIKVLERIKNGWLCDVCYPEECLDILEPPIEL